MDRLGVVIIDPYNDFLSFPGKSWLLTRRTPDFRERLENMRRVVRGCREAGVPLVYVPHARHRGDTYAEREHVNPSILQADVFRAFRDGGWGGRFRAELRPRQGDVVAGEHETSSGFVGTDLEELLRRHGVERVLACGCLSNTCVESTVRSGVDLGFEMGVLVDAIVAMSRRDHEAAKESFRAICHRTTTTDSLLEEIDA